MDNPTGPEVVDYGLVDGVSRRRGWEANLSNGKQPKREQDLFHPIPEGIMAELAEHLGDAQARVTVSAELAHSKEFGCKASSFVSVSVACNNNEQDILAVHNIIQPMAKQLVNEDLDAMKLDRDAHMEPAAQAPVGKVSPAPKVSSAPKVKPKAAPTTPAPAAANGKPVPARPSFRR